MLSERQIKLPNAERAVVDIRKLNEYCLNFNHERGKHKARLFSSILGLTIENAEVLREALISASQSAEAVVCGEDMYGTRYRIDFMMETRHGRAKTCSVWIVLKGEDFARMTTCYILKGE